MNRIVAWLALDGTIASAEMLEACKFNTPHWQPDHQSLYAEGEVTLSATQRFITPQCQAGLMPYKDKSSHCVINADVYLTNRDTLCELLSIDHQAADAIIVLHAYLKWGEKCTNYLKGQFCFILWDPRHKHLFAAVDQFAQIPLFYVYRPNQFVMLANECSAFHSLYPNLTLNPKHFVEFANDIYSESKTAYCDIDKLPAGHQLIITPQKLHKTRYWSWKDHQQTLPYKTKEQYYIALQQYFEKAVKSCTRSLGPLTTQVSGGLDSSAVTAQTALILGKQQQSLSAFTSTPNGLVGESYRRGWFYDELPRIEALMAQYPNIQHEIYRANPNTDIFEKLKPMQHCFDQPLRNINNLDWSLACYEHVLAQQGRVLLVGAAGNGTISWSGISTIEKLKSVYAALKSRTLLRRGWILNPHEFMLSGRLTAPLRASVYALQLWYGVRQLDPTQDLDLSVFCYNVPQWLYYRGKLPLQRRLLAREGLFNLLPEAVTQNPYRGEQGADWYLHYNQYGKHWQEQLQVLPYPAQKILWQSYDREKIMTLFDIHPYLKQPPDRKTTVDICYQLLRCLSVGFYLKECFNA